MIDIKNLSNEHEGEAVGDLCIRASAGEGEISIDATLIDVWLDAVVEALQRLRMSGDRIEIDLVDEPTPLIAFVDNHTVVFEYDEQKVLLGSYADARDHLIADVISIFPEVERRSESPQLLARIRAGIAALTGSPG